MVCSIFIDSARDDENSVPKFLMYLHLTSACQKKSHLRCAKKAILTVKQARKWRVLGLDRIVKKGCYLNKYQGNGGGVGVTPTKLKVPGSIPIVD